jgi:hypothetical protein
VQVRVFDTSLRLLAWFEDMAAGPVTSVSFAAVGGSVAGVAVGGALCALCCLVQCCPLRHTSLTLTLTWAPPTHMHTIELRVRFVHVDITVVLHPNAVVNTLCLSLLLAALQASQRR